MLELKDKRFVVTGASRGLGLAVARALLSEGAYVAVCSRSVQTLSELYSGYGGRALCYEVDIGEGASVERFASDVLHEWPWVDGVVNNASTLGVDRLKHLASTSYEELAEAIRVNYLGALKVVSAFLPPMVVRKSGVVVNITSDVASKPEAGWGAYAASKAALECASRVLAEELAPFGVRVHIYDPGDMDTELHRRALPDEGPEGLLSPEHSAKPILYLLSDAGKGLSGRKVSVYDFEPELGAK